MINMMIKEMKRFDCRDIHQYLRDNKRYKEWNNVILPHLINIWSPIYREGFLSIRINIQ